MSPEAAAQPAIFQQVANIVANSNGRQPLKWAAGKPLPLQGHGSGRW